MGLKLDFNTAHFLTLIGWIYVFYLNNRGLKRSDISRTKDSCITTIEKIIDDVRKHADSSESNPLTIESELTYFATKVEMKIKNLNSMTAKELISAENVAMIIRGCDTSELISNKEYAKEVIDSLADSCEKIEISYRELYFDSNILKRMYERRESEIKGLTFGLLILVSMFQIFEYL